MGKAEEIMERMETRMREEEFQRRHKEHEKDFTRNRKLGFEFVIKYILGNTRESMEMGKERYCEASGIESISGAAITKARTKVRYTAIEALFEEMAEMLPTPKKIAGYQVIAIDGMKGELPKTPELMKKYRASPASGYPQFHALAGYDVLNEFFGAAVFEPAPGNEYGMAMELLKHQYFSEEKQQLLLFDRGFLSVALIQALNTMGKKFIIRASKSSLKEINEFSKGTRVDQTVHIHYTKRRGATNRVHAKLPYDFELRCLKIELPDHSTELCVTNLEKGPFPRRKIKDLYHLRWGIEVGFNYLKNTIFVEEFSSRKENGIKQDFYASLWGANFLNFLLTQEFPLPPRSAEKKTLLSV